MSTLTQPSATANGVTAPLARIALLGASGYSGQVFARLALAHPRLAVAALVSRDATSAADLLQGTRAAGDTAVVTPDALPALFSDGTADVLVSALPHGVLRELLATQPMLAGKPRLILDLSQDHRAETNWAYGLPEAFRKALADTSRIANPGCYPTAATLAVLPALEAGLVNGPLTVVALSGVSGAGRKPQLGTSFVEVAEGACFYKVGEHHAHVPEMGRTFARLAGQPLDVAFAPQLVPMARGILATVTTTLAQRTTPEAAQTLWERRYADEPFVRVLPTGVFPATHAVRDSNRADVAVTTVHDGRTLVAMAAIDNLVKGAAGQALQNLNRWLGLPETTGLAVDGRPW